MKKKINYYCLFDWMQLFAMILFMLSLYDEAIKLKYVFVFNILVVVIGFIATSQKSKVINKSQRTVYIKPENKAGAIEVRPGETYCGLEGIRCYSTVYKLSDGLSAVIKEDGCMRIQSVTGKALTRLRPCAIAVPPDDDWNDLFNIPCHEWKK